MSEDILIRHGAPTLAGLKTGNLFSCAYASREGLAREVRALNRVLAPKGLRLVPMRLRDGRALLYLYRPARLEADLSRADARALLRAAGYPAPGQGNCLAELRRRLLSSDGFPHEIGLFLSYPPEDVEGFILNKGRGSKCVGCWKVYGDEAAARRSFRAYKQCTDSYRERRAGGARLAQLAVAG